MIGGRLAWTPVEAGDRARRTLKQGGPQRFVAGCPCQGRLGPVGGRTFVHGFTASVARW